MSDVLNDLCGILVARHSQVAFGSHGSLLISRSPNWTLESIRCGLMDSKRTRHYGDDRARVEAQT